MNQIGIGVACVLIALTLTITLTNALQGSQTGAVPLDRWTGSVFVCGLQPTGEITCLPRF